MDDKKTILIVEDEGIQRKALAALMSRLGFASIEAENGAAAERLLRDLSPEAVLLDWHLPDVDGLTLLTKWQKDEKLKWIPVIVVTGNDNANQISLALDAGASDFVSKPPKEGELSARLRSALRLKELQDNLRELSVRDPLTGLYNRRYFYERLEGEVQRADRYSRPLSCVIIDLDFFKSINDSFGHDIGDRVLQRVAITLTDGLRDSDVVARFGGEEFILLLTESTETQAFECVERLRKSIEQFNWKVIAENLSVTASSGISFFEEGNDQDALVKKADQALYNAKHAGRNQARRFSQLNSK